MRYWGHGVGGLAELSFLGGGGGWRLAVGNKHAPLKKMRHSFAKKNWQEKSPVA